VEINLKVADGREAKVEVIRTLPLVLHGGFTLVLNCILFVPSLQRNLVYVAFLEDEGYECIFGNNKSMIKLDGKFVGLAPRQGMFNCCPLMISL
jgi:hypothetical protein